MTTLPGTVMPMQAPLAYYQPPNSLMDMDNGIYAGLIVIGTLALASTIFTAALLGFITWRLASWRHHYSTFIGHNQPLILIYQLLIGDFLQSQGFVISYHWAVNRNIVGPTNACFAQGWFIQLGDLVSGLFVLTIALHTTYQVVMARKVSYRAFMWTLGGVWSLALTLACLAPIIGGRYVFLRAGVWCWISTDHEDLRLILHYLWVFIAQFGSTVVYMIGFYYLYRKSRPGSNLVHANEQAYRKASTAMLAYALVYTVLTLPLAAGRMAAMAGVELPNIFFLIAGALFTSSGWVDTLLYAITRRALLFKELDPDPNKGVRINSAGTKASSAGRPQKPNPRHLSSSSTDSILTMNGIMMDTTVKVEMDDLGSQGYQEYGHFVTAKADRS